jgi:hypothetical protein
MQPAANLQDVNAVYRVLSHCPLRALCVLPCTSRDMPMVRGSCPKVAWQGLSGCTAGSRQVYDKTTQGMVRAMHGA